MSQRLHRGMYGTDRPTPPGRRRRPRPRELEITRPPAVYRYAIHSSLIKLGVIERIREVGFSRAGEA